MISTFILLYEICKYKIYVEGIRNSVSRWRASWLRYTLLVSTCTIISRAFITQPVLSVIHMYLSLPLFSEKQTTTKWSSSSIEELLTFFSFSRLVYYIVDRFAYRTLYIETPPARRQSQSIQIFVKTYSGKTKTISVEQTESVASLKRKVSEKEDIPLSNVRLSYGGKGLQDSQTLYYYNIQKDCTLLMSL